MLNQMLNRRLIQTTSTVGLLGGLVMSSFAISGVAQAGFLQERIEADRALAKLIDGVNTREDLSAKFGSDVIRCTESSETTELCGWELSNQDKGWYDVAEIVDTNKRVSIVCAMPKDSTEARMKGSCSASPRTSNRELFKYAPGTALAEQAVDRTRERALMEDYKAVAQAWMSQARTLASMTRLMGTLPERCQKVEGELRRCVWRLDKKDFGHGTAAMSIGATMRGRVRLNCAFPLSGGPRGEQSCTVERGG